MMHTNNELDKKRLHTISVFLGADLGACGEA